MNITFKSIHIQILFWAGICLVMVAGFLIFYSSISIQDSGELVAQEQAVAVAREEAASFRSEFESTMNSAGMLTTMFITSKSTKISLLGRGQVIELFRGILKDHPTFLGIYTGWEENAFDGRDVPNANMDGHDGTGRFIPYLVWSNGEILLTPLLDSDKEGIGDYYLIPKRTKKAQIIEPFLYPIDGKDVLLTSLIVPIVVSDEFLGITGIDLRLDYLQSLADQKEIFGGAGEMFLVSNGGILAANSSHPDEIGRPLVEVKSDWKEFLPAIKAGEEIIRKKNRDLVVITPVEVRNTESPWAVIITIPIRVINQDAIKMTMRMVTIGLILTGMRCFCCGW